MQDADISLDQPVIFQEVESHSKALNGGEATSNGAAGSIAPSSLGLALLCMCLWGVRVHACVRMRTYVCAFVCMHLRDASVRV